MKRPAPGVRIPRGLKTAGRGFFRDVAEFCILEPHHVALLTLGAEALDRYVAARKVLDAEGMTFTDKHGQPRARPEVQVERDSRIAVVRILRELGIDVEQPEARKPPTIAGRAALRVLP